MIKLVHEFWTSQILNKLWDRFIATLALILLIKYDNIVSHLIFTLYGYKKINADYASETFLFSFFLYNSQFLLGAGFK